MLAELGIAVGIAAVDSLNPATIGQASVLSGDQRPYRALLAFWAGAGLLYALLGAVLVLGPGQLIEGLVRNPPPVLRLAQLGLGLVALVAGIVVWRRRHTMGIGRRLSRGGSEIAFRLGFLTALADVPNAFPFYGLVAYLAGSGLSRPRQLLIVGVYTFVYLSPVLAVLAVRAVVGERAEPLLVKIRDFVERRTATVAAIVLMVGGCVLSVHAVGKLLGTW